MVWGWTEVSFLTGWITGPRRTASPPGTRGLTRLGHAVAAIIYHELAILAGFVVVLAISWGGENQTATLTYGVLWAMRLSAKINIFLGVPNHADGFLPDHLAYLKSWFTRKPMNVFFPVSVSAALVVLVLVALPAVSADAERLRGRERDARRDAAGARRAGALVPGPALRVDNAYGGSAPGGARRARPRSRPASPRAPPCTHPPPAPVARPAPAMDDDKHAYSLWRR